MLPLEQPGHGFIRERYGDRQNIVILVNCAFQLHKSGEYALPFGGHIECRLLHRPPGRFFVAEQDKQNAVNKTVGGAFPFGMFGKNAFLHCADYRYKRTLDEDRAARTFAVGHGGLCTEHRQPELFLRAVVVTVEVLDPCRQFVGQETQTTAILRMNEAQTFWSNIRHKKTAADRFTGADLNTFFCTFLPAHFKLLQIFQILFLVNPVLFVVVFHKRTHCKTQRMALVGARSSDESHI